DLTIHPCSIKAGDAIILSGDIGRHGMAVMVEREKLSIASSLQSDCASVSQVVQALIKADVNIHCLRDVTRGGLATTLCELANDSGYSFEVQETNIPIDQDVVSISELLGIDPFYAACEGRFVLFVPASDVSKALQVLTSFDISSLAKEIGYVVADKKSQVINCNPYGVKKLLTMLTYEGLPRIC